MIVLFINVINSRNISSRNIFLDNSSKKDILFLLIFILLIWCRIGSRTLFVNGKYNETYMLEACNGSRII